QSLSVPISSFALLFHPPSRSSDSSSYPLQIPVWSNCDHQLVFDGPVDLEQESAAIRTGPPIEAESSEVLANGGLRIVPLVPRAIREHTLRQVLDDGVEHNAITARSNERRIGFELGQDVVVGVIGIQYD